MEIIILRQGKLFDCIERNGHLKDTKCNTKNSAINVDLFQNRGAKIGRGESVVLFGIYVLTMKLLKVDSKLIDR